MHDNVFKDCARDSRPSSILLSYRPLFSCIVKRPFISILTTLFIYKGFVCLNMEKISLSISEMLLLIVLPAGVCLGFIAFFPLSPWIDALGFLFDGFVLINTTLLHFNCDICKSYGYKVRSRWNYYKRGEIKTCVYHYYRKDKFYIRALPSYQEMRRIAEREKLPLPPPEVIDAEELLEM
jgi:hypothetical protein